MYEIKGFMFKENEDKVERIPFMPGLLATSYDEVHEVMKEMGITHYMFMLKEVKE